MTGDSLLRHCHHYHLLVAFISILACSIAPGIFAPLGQILYLPARLKGGQQAHVTADVLMLGFGHISNITCGEPCCV